jgi:hypothetical protein
MKNNLVIIITDKYDKDVFNNLGLNCFSMGINDISVIQNDLKTFCLNKYPEELIYGSADILIIWDKDFDEDMRNKIQPFIEANDNIFAFYHKGSNEIKNQKNCLTRISKNKYKGETAESHIPNGHNIYYNELKKISVIKKENKDTKKEKYNEVFEKIINRFYREEKCKLLSELLQPSIDLDKIEKCYFSIDCLLVDYMEYWREFRNKIFQNTAIIKEACFNEEYNEALKIFRAKLNENQ